MILQYDEIGQEYIYPVQMNREEKSAILSIFNKHKKGYVFDPLYKRKLWDGIIKTIEPKDFKIPIAAAPYLIKEMTDGGFDISFTNENPVIDSSLDRAYFHNWCIKFFKNCQMKPRDYQEECAYRMLKNRRCMAQLATSAGKTMISFVIFAYMLDQLGMQNCLIVVPSASLINQTAADFEDYMKNTTLRAKVAKFGGSKKQQITKIKTIMVATFQSVCLQPTEFYEDFEGILVDEVHRAECKSIQDILEHCKAHGYKYRMGLSGTIPDTTYSNGVTLITSIGCIVDKITTKTLQDAGFITPVMITQLHLKYTTPEQKKSFEQAAALLKGQKKYKDLLDVEKKFRVASSLRLQYICKLASQTKKNVMILYEHVEYGQRMYETLQAMCGKDKEIYLIDGSTPAKTREVIRKRVDEKENVILLGSNAIATGFSIKRIHFCFLIEAQKSDVMVLQSIGRSLRQLDNKDTAYIVDFSDILFDDCYCQRHAAERREIYEEQCFPCTVKVVDLLGNK